MYIQINLINLKLFIFCKPFFGKWKFNIQSIKQIIK